MNEQSAASIMSRSRWTKIVATSLGVLFLFLVVLGVVIGLFIGAMPGLGSVNGVAILLPMTFLVPPTGAIIQDPLL